MVELARYEEMDRLYHCLIACMQSKTYGCKAFNYGINGTCILLAESLCANETYVLTENDQFNYYDLMATPDYEVSRNIG